MYRKWCELRGCWNYCVLVCINACSWAQKPFSWQLAHHTNLFIPQIMWRVRERESKRNGVTTKNVVLVRTWKREMAVSRRYNNVTLCGNVLLYVSRCFSFSLAFVSFYSCTLPQCLRLLPLHIHFWILYVCVLGYVCARALKCNTNKKRMRVSCSKILFVIFFILFLIFVFVSFFSHTHTH